MRFGLGLNHCFPLFKDCTITSAAPGVDMVETESAKPGYWGRPWDKNAETVFFNTTVEANGSSSLITAAGWNDGLVSGGSERSYEYGTIEQAGVDNSSSRVSWATVLTEPTLPDGTAIRLLNFTKGTDEWNPFEEEEQTDAVEAICSSTSTAQKVMIDGHIYIVRENRTYNISGMEIK